jgi:anti-sigma regulatory factor (Ser/Thr protein kinase)
MGLSQVGLPTRTKVDPAVRRPLDLTARLQNSPGRPRVVRMPSDWWDSPAVVACPLSTGAQSGRAARRFTRNTLREWGLATLADDAEAIVGEFVANAVSHAARLSSGQPLGLRLLRRTGEVMCAVLDPSDTAPVLRMPDRSEECGRGLQMVDALSDVWGWSPVTGRGKAVWAILFCGLPSLLAFAILLPSVSTRDEGGHSPMPWTWRYEKADGTVINHEDLAEAIFASQGDAESWLGENWRALLGAGVDQVTLLNDATTEYGPMRLQPED